MEIELPDKDKFLSNLRTRSRDIFVLGTRVLRGYDKEDNKRFAKFLDELYSSKDFSTRVLAMYGAVSSKTTKLIERIYEEETSIKLLQLTTKMIFKVYDQKIEKQETKEFFKKAIMESVPKIQNMLINQIVKFEKHALADYLFPIVAENYGILIASKLAVVVNKQIFGEYQEKLIPILLTGQSKKNMIRILDAHEDQVIRYLSTLFESTNKEQHQSLIEEHFKFLSVFLKKLPIKYLQFAQQHIPLNLRFIPFDNKIAWISKRCSDLLFSYLTEKSYIKDQINNETSYHQYWIGKHVRQFTLKQKLFLGKNLLLISLESFFDFLSHLKPKEREILFVRLLKRQHNYPNLALSEEQLVLLPKKLRKKECERVVNLKKEEDHTFYENLLSCHDIEIVRTEFLKNYEKIGNNSEPRANNVCSLIRCSLLSRNAEQILITFKWLNGIQTKWEEKSLALIWKQIFCWTFEKNIDLEICQEIKKFFDKIFEDKSSFRDQRSLFPVISHFIYRMLNYFITKSNVSIANVDNNNENLQKRKQQNESDNSGDLKIIDHFFQMYLTLYNNDLTFEYLDLKYFNFRSKENYWYHYNRQTIQLMRDRGFNLSYATISFLIQKLYTPEIQKLNTYDFKENKYLFFTRNFSKYLLKSGKYDQDFQSLIQTEKITQYNLIGFLKYYFHDRTRRAERLQLLLEKYKGKVINISIVQRIAIQKRQDLIASYKLFDSSVINSHSGDNQINNWNVKTILKARAISVAAKTYIRNQKRGKAFRNKDTEKKYITRENRRGTIRKQNMYYQETNEDYQEDVIEDNIEMDILSKFNIQGNIIKIFPNDKSQVETKDIEIDIDDKSNEKKEIEIEKKTEKEEEEEEEKGKEIEIEKGKEEEKEKEIEIEKEKEEEKEREKTKTEIMVENSSIQKNFERNDGFYLVNHSKYIWKLDSNLQKKYIIKLLAILLDNKQLVKTEKSTFELYYKVILKNIVRQPEFDIQVLYDFLEIYKDEVPIVEFLLINFLQMDSKYNKILDVYKSFFDSDRTRVIVNLLYSVSRSMKREAFSDFLVEYTKKQTLKITVRKEILRMFGKINPNECMSLIEKIWKIKSLHKDNRLTILSICLNSLTGLKKTWDLFDRAILNKELTDYEPVIIWFLDHSPLSMSKSDYNNWMKCLLLILDNHDLAPHLVESTLLAIQEFFIFIRDESVIELMLERIQKIIIKITKVWNSWDIALQILIKTSQLFKIGNKFILSTIKLLIVNEQNENENENTKIIQSPQVNPQVIIDRDNPKLSRLKTLLRRLGLISIDKDFNTIFVQLSENIQNLLEKNNLMSSVLPQFILLLINFNKFDKQNLQSTLLKSNNLISKYNFQLSMKMIANAVSEIAGINLWLQEIDGLVQWFVYLSKNENLFIRYYLLILINQFIEQFGCQIVELIDLIEKLKSDEDITLRYLALQTIID
ncbi:transcription elongation factor a [Anaeramoeba flamelloides]|uniref:Transcription elongation factor a n=1 Tax=Anaeramoeba flamelloides TaxID=1746091 RepID=A0AAV7ZVC9_9EUKA|nr:transcription elongation factor a [Anaeramoeba flamelloides]